MKLALVAARHTWQWTLRLSIILILLGAILLSLAPVLVSHLSDYRVKLERSISEYLHAPVRIRGLEATWQDSQLVLRLDGFSLLDPVHKTSLASFKQGLVTLDMPRSLWAGRPVLRNIRLEGVRLILEREADGRLRLMAQAASGPSVSLPEAAAWLFDIHSLDLLADELQLRDVAGGMAPLVFSDLRLSLRADGKERHLGLALTLPPALGRGLQAAVALQGEPHDPAGWTATFYARGDNLALPGWPLPAAPAAGQANVQVWGDWQGQGLSTVIGQAHFQDLLPPKRPGTAALRQLLADLPALSADFAWQRQAGGWRWRSHWTGRDAAGKPVVRTALDLGLDTQEDHLQGHALNLRLQDLTAAAALWLDKPQSTLLTGIAPRGEVPELAFRVALDAKAYTLSARFQELATRAWGHVPAIKGLNGNVFLNQDGGWLDLKGHDLQVDAMDLLRAPVSLDTLAGPLWWRHDATGLRLGSAGIRVAAADLNARLQGSLTLFADGTSPFIDLALDCHDLNIGRASAYLPVPLIKPRLVEWLDRALVSGHVSRGRIVFRGRTADFPFADNEGLFEARLQVDNAVLDYFPGWPRIEGLEAEVVFRNHGLQVVATAGKIFDADLQQVSAHMDDLAHGALAIQARAQGSAATLLRFLRESPLAEKLGGPLADIAVTGDNSLDLALTIPFHHQPIAVKGEVGFTGGSVTLPAWNLALTAIQGSLGFTETGLTASDIRLLFRGEPARLDIDTRRRQDGDRETRLQIEGRFSPKALLGGQAAAIEPYISGRGPWRLTLVVPAASHALATPFDLLLASDLEGVEVRLPSPFGKTAEEQRAFYAHLSSGRTARLHLRLDYDSHIRAMLELTDFPSAPRFSRGELRINAGKASLPAAPGLAVVARLPYLEWPLASGTTGKPGGFTWLSSIDAYLDEWVIGGQRLPGVHLQAEQRAEALVVTVTGETLAGRIQIPAAPSPQAPLRVELRRLALSQAQEKEDATTGTEGPDPRGLPPLWVVVEDLRLDDRPLGRLHLVTLPQANGLHLARLELNSELHRIVANGDWLVREEGQFSRLQARLHSQELGRTLRAFGYAVGLERSEAEAELTVHWPAPFPAFAAALLEGRLALQVGRGQLLEVDPGMGRMVGLLNLQSLSRRLALDFSDLFQKGLGFDSINGTFTLKNGNAYTQDLQLRAPSARIDIEGRIGLKDRDYDQTITVMPRVSSALPIAGTIAGGPAVGAALLLAERLLREDIDQAARYWYSVTGPWEQPVIERIQEPAGLLESPTTGDQ